MKKVYVDTSAFIKLFIEEEGGEAVQKLALLANENKIRMVISEWVVNESVAVVAKKFKKGLIDRKEASEILSNIADILEGIIQKLNVESHPISQDAIIGSRIIIQDVHPNASDALHIFIAAISKCNYFVTADMELIRSIRSSLLPITPINILRAEDLAYFFNDVEHE